MVGRKLLNYEGVIHGHTDGSTANQIEFNVLAAKTMSQSGEEILYIGGIQPQAKKTAVACRNKCVEQIERALRQAREFMDHLKRQNIELAHFTNAKDQELPADVQAVLKQFGSFCTDHANTARKVEH